MSNQRHKEPNYQNNVFHRFSVRQQHINMFVGYVFGRMESQEIDDTSLFKLCQEWIDKFDLDIDKMTLYNSYRIALQVFKDCLKAEKR